MATATKIVSLVFMDYTFISVFNTLKQTGSLFVNDIGTRPTVR
jgi:hypothetical protein